MIWGSAKKEYSITYQWWSTEIKEICKIREMCPPADTATSNAFTCRICSHRGKLLGEEMWTLWTDSAEMVPDLPKDAVFYHVSNIVHQPAVLAIKISTWNSSVQKIQNLKVALCLCRPPYSGLQSFLHHYLTEFFFQSSWPDSESLI